VKIERQQGAEDEVDSTMPPTWVPLAEVGVWINKVYRPTNLASLYLDFKLLLRSRPQHARLHYRLGPFLPKDVRKLPPGLKVAFHEDQRIGVVVPPAISGTPD